VNGRRRDPQGDDELTLRALLRPHAVHRHALVRWTLLAFLPPFATGRLVASAVDAVIAGHAGAAAWWLGALAVVGVVGAWASQEQVRATAWLSEAVRTDLTRRVVERSLGAGASTSGRGQGGAELTTHIETLRDTLSNTLRFLPGVFSAFAAIAGVATLSPVLALILLPFVALVVPAYAWYLRAATHATAAHARSEEAVQSEIALVLEGVRDVVARRAEQRAMQDVRGRLATRREAVVRTTWVSTAGQKLMQLLLGHGPLLAVLIALPWLLERGSLSVGGAVGAVTYVQRTLGEMFGFVTFATMSFVNLSVVLDRLRGLAPPLPPARERAGSLPVDTTVRVESLSFRYSPTAHPIVADLDLELPEGDHLAIVGPSGIGKSTLAGLLVGILAPTSGRVTIGGVRVTDLDDDARRQLIAVVPQESYVFTGTLRENLAYLRPDATEEQILASVREVGALRVVDRLGGLDAQVATTTSGLSEGERQLIGLARIHLSPASVVMLDEATCYLDPVAEEQAERAFQRRGGTLVVIAHRMTSSLRARRVLVLDGDTARLGTHGELIDTDPMYADLHGLWAADPTPA